MKANLRLCISKEAMERLKAKAHISQKLNGVILELLDTVDRLEKENALLKQELHGIGIPKEKE